MFRVVEQAFKSQILEDSEYMQVMKDYRNAQANDLPESRGLVTKNFEKMK